MDTFILNCSKSGLVKIIKSAGNKTYKDIAAVLGISEAYVNNKIHRNSWSIDDIGKLCSAFNMRVTIMGKDMYELRTLN